MDTTVTLPLLQFGSLEVKGVLPWSSNYSFLATICPNAAVQQALADDDPDVILTETTAIYKPRRGERPLWDFASGTLCQRERAAFLVSQALTWDLVPPTVLRDGPHGFGSVQLFINHDPEIHYFAFEGDAAFREQLQKTVLLDIIINNADRKAGHVLLEEGSDQERLWLIDHGICFHTDYKLRTVIWEFAGQPIPNHLLNDLRAFQTNLSTNQNAFRRDLEKLLSSAEIITLQKRLQRVIDQGIFLMPGPGRHYPWPPV